MNNNEKLNKMEKQFLKLVEEYYSNDVREIDNKIIEIIIHMLSKGDFNNNNENLEIIRQEINTLLEIRRTKEFINNDLGCCSFDFEFEEEQ